MTRPPAPRILCLDIEGGHGGSSRSLFESIRHLDRSAVEVEVWCRRKGPIAERYAAIGVPCLVVPDMPRFTPLARFSRNLYATARAFADFHAARGFRAELVRTVEARFDLVHFNHESLFLLARWFRGRTRAPFTMHVRTRQHDTAFARWQARTVAEVADHVIFITENERDRLAELGGRPRRSTVIHNIVTPSDEVPPHTAVPRDNRLKVACLSNYAWVRGIDRLVEIAEALARRGRRDVLFVVAGDMHLTRSLPGTLGAIGRRGGTLADHAAERGVADMFLFLGHVETPERVLAASDVLIKPTREGNPWGRDILEGLAAGLPVISFGSYHRFVEHGVTGILRERFDAAETAADILALADDPERRKRLGAAGRARVAELCDGPARAADLLAVWRAALVAP